MTAHGEKITILAAVPTLLRAIVADESVRAPRLDKILTGGEPFSPALADKVASLFPQAGVFDLFGLTETGSCDFCVRPEDQVSARGTIGRATEGVAFRIAHLPESTLVELVLERCAAHRRIRTSAH